MHPKDIKYFNEFPSPIMENLHKMHFININATIPFSPILYFLVRFLRSEKVLEAGHAEGYSAYYLASGVADNATRFQYRDAMYYGFDVVKGEFVKENLDKLGLPNTIINLDTKDLTSETFKGIEFDLIFQDGSHKEEDVLHEMEVLYPQLKGDGKGVLVCHDVFGPAEEGVRKIIENPKYKWEYVRLFDEVYGLAILRKMDGYDHEKRYWYESKGAKNE